jgi:predicted RNA-binding Zn-ribbon protein involved in translation (DUF1610 family)
MKTKYGHMACPDCGATVVVKQNEHGTLSYNCNECDANAYCRKGAGNRAAWDNRITRTAAPEKPKPGEKPDPGAGKKSVLDDLL